MINAGSTIFAERTGRAPGPLAERLQERRSPADSSADWIGWPRTGAMCAPLVQCCCKGPWTLAPGEVQSLLLNWRAWLTSEAVQGFNLYAVAQASLWDMTKSPPQIADANIIKITSGTVNDPDPPDNSDAADLFALRPPFGAQTLISVSQNARIGQFHPSFGWPPRACACTREEAVAMLREESVDIGEIDAGLRACIEELASLPGSRLVKRKGRLFLKGKNGFEILVERLCEIKARWVELVEHAPMSEEDKWKIFTLLLTREDARLEQVPGGLKVTLPGSPRH